MKKNYLFLAAATTLFAACVQTDVVTDIPEPQQQAISFDAFANKTTRAQITNTSDLQKDNGGFHVWGYKYCVGEAEYTVFNNEPISWDATNEKWDYTNTRYWDETATYKFYAAAPKEPASVNYFIGPKTFNFDTEENRIVKNLAAYHIAIQGADNSVDYLIDRDGTASKIVDDETLTGRDGFDNNIVSFNFNHIMSKISFKLKAGVAEKIVVTSLTMEGWNDGAGTFIQSDNYDTQHRNNTEWTMTSTTPGLCTILENGSLVIDNTAAVAVPEYSLIAIPQDIAQNNLKFTISFNIVRGVVDGSTGAPADDPKDEVFINQVGILANSQSWYTDTHTTYTIIVTPDAIEFGNPSVAEWSYPDNKNPEELPL